MKLPALIPLLLLLPSSLSYAADCRWRCKMPEETERPYAADAERATSECEAQRSALELLLLRSAVPEYSRIFHGEALARVLFGSDKKRADQKKYNY